MTATILGLLGPLDVLVADHDVSDVLVNGGREVWVERHGVLQRTSIVLAVGQIEHIIERLLAPLGVRADLVSPVADARLPDGSRLHVVVPPVSPDGMTVSIRRFRSLPISLDGFAPPEVVRLLQDAVRCRANIVVSGATSAGKTTLLNALAGCCPVTERIITIEDAAELRLPGDHVVRLEARRASADGLGAVTVRDLVRAALRMRPDRLVIGELRGGEALDALQAFNTGHDGSLTTCHANSARDALDRLDTMALLAASGLPLEAISRHVQRAVDLVVHVARGSEGRRRIIEVAETTNDADRLRTLALERGRLPGPSPVWIGRAS
jgi:pilus assembly protein CpaF